MLKHAYATALRNLMKDMRMGAEAAYEETRMRRLWNEQEIDEERVREMFKPEPPTDE